MQNGSIQTLSCK